MEDIFQVNDWVMVNKFVYQFGDLQCGDVVVFDDLCFIDLLEELVFEVVICNVGEVIGVLVLCLEFIKCVIVFFGECIEIIENVVYIDGQVFDELYLKLGMVMFDFELLVVQVGEMFVMGDNCNLSQDSWFFGIVFVDIVVGKVFVIMWFVDWWGLLQFLYVCCLVSIIVLVMEVLMYG